LSSLLNMSLTRGKIAIFYARVVLVVYAVKQDRLMIFLLTYISLLKYSLICKSFV